MALVRLGVPHPTTDDSELMVTPEEFGTTNHPFSTARADLSPLATNTSYPYRASGKLFFNIGTSTFVCSASLIGRGIVVTAAHCVADFASSSSIRAGNSFLDTRTALPLRRVVRATGTSLAILLGWH